ncbi:hypothetical protein BB987_17220 [Photorhabdus temperata]|nr:hypothetical protein BB987_17220 [Photorhabdus temperata]
MIILILNNQAYSLNFLIKWYDYLKNRKKHIIITNSIKKQYKIYVLHFYLKYKKFITTITFKYIKRIIIR